MTCPICNHIQRAEIEQKLLYRSAGDGTVTLEQIATEYKVRVLDLQVHALMHTSVISQSESGEATTLVQAIKFKEGEYLRQSIIDYQLTMAVLGGKIRTIVHEHSSEESTLHKLTKPVVDLYLGLGTEIRSAVDLLTKMNGSLNDSSNNALDGLKALVTAIKSSGDSDDTV